MSFTGNLKTVAFPDILQLLSSGKKTGISGNNQEKYSERDLF